MAVITARFVANLDDFKKTLAEGQTVVKSLGATTAQVNRDLARLGNDFSGAKVIREAETAAKAVEQIGGATRLTEAEQRKLNGIVTEAIAKYEALGQQAPDNLKRLATETTKAADASKQIAVGVKGAESSLGSLGGVAAKLGPALIGAFSIGAVTSFAKSVIDLGSQIEDLSGRTGVGIEAVQELKFAADQTGSSIDTVAGALDQMNNRLTEGSKGTRAAVKDLGLSLSELRQQSPEDAFTALVARIKDIPDPMRQTQLAMELFGKSGTQLLPAIRQGFADLRQQARDTGQVISEDNVKALAAFGDMWDRTMTRIKASSASAILDVGRGFSGMFADLRKGLEGLVPDGLVSFLNNPTIKAILQSSGRALAAQPIFGGGLVNILNDARARGAQERGQQNLQDLFKQVSRRDFGSGAGGSRGGADVQELTAEQKAIQALADTLTGADIAGKLKQLDAAWKQLTPSQKANEETIKRLVTAYSDLRQKAGLKDLPSDLEGVHRANLPIVRSTEDMITVIRRLSTTTLPDLSKRTAETTALLAGFRRDGLLPVTESFADLSATNMIPWPIEGVKNAGAEILKTTESTVGLTGSLDDVSRAFAQLDQIRPLEGWIADVAQLINLMNVAGQAGAQLGALLTKQTRDAAGNVSTSFSLDAFRNTQGQFSAGSVAAGGLQAAQFGIASVGAIDQATDVQGRGNRALRGAATGASIGANPALVAATGGLSILAGAAIGALVGALRNPGFEQEMKRISKNFGVNISEELARSIDKQKKQFGGNRDAAEIFNLDKIIAEGGGVKDKNVNQLTERLRDSFVQLEVGKFSVEQTREVLDKNFAAFADHIKKSESIAGKSFQDLFELNKRFETNSEAIKQFVEGQTAALGTGVATLAGPLIEQYGGLADEITAAKEAVNALSAEGRQGTDAYAEAVKNLNTLQAEQAEGAATAAAEFERLGVIALGSFNASLRAGTDTLTAVNALGPGLDSLLQLQKDLGIESENAGLAELTRFRDLVNNNQTLVASTGALGETLRALASIGGLTTETLAAMEAQGVQTFDRLIAAGFSENQALTQMKGFLVNVIEAHQQLGTPIDENTQRLIAQAQEMGILKDDGKDLGKVLKDGFTQVKDAILLVAKGLGVDVPRAAEEATKSIDKIPRDIDVGVNVHYNDPGHTPQIDTEAGVDAPGAAHGIFASGRAGVATWFGEAGAPELGGPVDFMGDVLAHAMARNNMAAIASLDDLARSRMGGSGEQIIQLYVGGRLITERVVRHMPSVVKLHAA